MIVFRLWAARPLGALATTAARWRPFRSPLTASVCGRRASSSLSSSSADRESRVPHEITKGGTDEHSGGRRITTPADAFNRSKNWIFVPKIREPLYRYVWFFKYHPFEDPEAVRDTLFSQWYEWAVLGRIFVADEGINAQMIVPVSKIQQFEAHIRNASPGLANLELRYGRDVDVTKEALFPNLHVRIRPYIVNDGLKEPLNLSDSGAFLSPGEWQEAVMKEVVEPPPSGEKGLLIDCRNFFESEVGRFKGAVQMNVEYFRESFGEVDRILSETKADPRKTPVYIYCTGGIRCIKVGAYLRGKGYEKVAALDGGINAYMDYIEGEASRARLEGKSEPSRLFIGKNYVFDGRGLVGNETERATTDVLGKCLKCGSPGDLHINCSNSGCNSLFIMCPSCTSRLRSAANAQTAAPDTAGFGVGKSLKRDHTPSDKATGARKSGRKSGSKPMSDDGVLIASERRLTQHTLRAPCSDECTEIVERYPGEHIAPSQRVRFRRSFHSSATRQTATNGTNALPPYTPKFLKPTPTSIYCEAHSTPLSTYCVAAESCARENDPTGAHMVSGHLQGRLLSMLCASVAPARALDVGTYTGFSAMSLAEGLDLVREPEACVVSLETSTRAHLMATMNAATHPRRDRIEFKLCDALEHMTWMADEGLEVDFVYLDADKKKYKAYYEVLFGRRLLTRRGVVVIDNVLFHGCVAPDGPQPDDVPPARLARNEAMAKTLREFNAHVIADGRAECVMLPIRDGISLVRWRS